MKQDSLDCFIGKLYDNFDMYTSNDFEETKKAEDEVYKLFWDNDLFEDIRLDLEDVITDAYIQHARQGFIQGFKRAMVFFLKSYGNELN